MTTAIAAPPSPTHREQQPVVRCVKCGCYLRSYHRTDTCDPCDGTPDLDSIDLDLVIDAAVDATTRERRRIFDGFTELMEG